MKNIVVMILVILSLISFGSLSAQEDSTSYSFSVGSDFVSRYIWRGLDINNAACIQPSLYFNVGGFSIGFWGSYALSKDPKRDAIFDSEVDPSISYTIQTESSGSFTAIVTDYYYPEYGVRMGNFEDYNKEEGTYGAHTIETGVTYTGPESFPIGLYAGLNVYNDPGNSNYFEVSYPFAVNDVDLDVFVGATTGHKDFPEWYGIESFSVINAGIKGTKSIKITDSFSLPVFVSYILNPAHEVSFLVFGISL